MFSKLIPLTVLFIISCNTAPHTSYNSADYFYKAAQDSSTQPHDRVTSAPESLRGNVFSLTKYITHGAESDYEKIRRIHDWIVLNIAYDTDAYFNNAIRDGDAFPVMVLTRKRTICMGYSSLFKHMCDIAHVQAKTLVGYAIGPRGYEGHTWNIVLVEGEEYYIDATWDAGYLSNKSFKRHYSKKYFMMTLKAISRDHFR